MEALAISYGDKRHTASVTGPYYWQMAAPLTGSRPAPVFGRGILIGEHNKTT